MIIGLTDKPVLRRDGKIRAGEKDERTSKLTNTPHFLLHDAPALESIFGETVKELYFTVYFDEIEQFMKADLRWYSAAQLLCKSMHNELDADGKSLGQSAAYFGPNQVAGMKQVPFPRIDGARLRSCGYASCPEYLKGQCTEHMFLDIVVPQCSMASLFTLDNTSMKAILNANSTFSKAKIYGKLGGQIFRLFKKEEDGSRPDGKGGKLKTRNWVIQVERVPFEEYEAKFKDQIKTQDWNALMMLRQQPIGFGFSGGEIPFSAPDLLPPPEEAPALLESTVTAQDATIAGELTKSDEDILRERANDPSVSSLFEELALMRGVENSEEKRIATVKHFPSTKDLTAYLQSKLKEAKKEAAPSPTPAPEVAKDVKAEVLDAAVGANQKVDAAKRVHGTASSGILF